MEVVSLGFGYQFDKWTMDGLVVTMNGISHNDTSHNCVEFGFTVKFTWGNQGFLGGLLANCGPSGAICRDVKVMDVKPGGAAYDCSRIGLSEAVQSHQNSRSR